MDVRDLGIVVKPPILNRNCSDWNGGIVCCVECYNSHGDCVEGGNCDCHRGLRTLYTYCHCDSCKALRGPAQTTAAVVDTPALPMTNPPPAPKPSAFEAIPEPYRGVIERIKPRDLYIIREMAAGGDEVVDITHVPADASAQSLHDIEVRRAAPTLSVRTVTGRGLRSLILELARADGVPLYPGRVDLDA